jgi:hypothetical protein
MGIWQAFIHSYQSLHGDNHARLLHRLTYGCLRESLPRLSEAARKTPSPFRVTHDQDLPGPRIDYQGIGYIFSLRFSYSCHSQLLS